METFSKDVILGFGQMLPVPGHRAALGRSRYIGNLWGADGLLKADCPTTFHSDFKAIWTFCWNEVFTGIYVEVGAFSRCFTLFMATQGFTP